MATLAAIAAFVTLFVVVIALIELAWRGTEHKPPRGPLIGLALAVGLLGALQSTSGVDAHHLGDHLPGDPMSYEAARRPVERGYVTYCADPITRAFPGFVSQMTLVDDYAESIGLMHSELVDYGPGCDVVNMMPADADFVRICGDQAFACIYPGGMNVAGVGLAQPVYYRRARAFPGFDFKSAQCHEGGGGNTGHARWLHERYDDVNFTSRGDRSTCMDFGTFVWQATPRDRDRIWNADVPDRPSNVGFVVPGNGYAYVTWDQRRADNGAAHLNGIAANTNATRMSFAWSPTPDAPPSWIGDVCGSDYGYCFTNPRDGYRGFDVNFWRGCLWLRAENAAYWYVPQVSAPNWWTLAGCTDAPFVAASFPDNTGDATCIAWKETRFKADAVGGDGERGPFQIHPIHFAYGASPAYGYTWADMFDAYANADVAARIQRDQGWRPWTTRALCGL